MPLSPKTIETLKGIRDEAAKGKNSYIAVIPSLGKLAEAMLEGLTNERTGSDER